MDFIIVQLQQTLFTQPFGRSGNGRTEILVWMCVPFMTHKKWTRKNGNFYSEQTLLVPINWLHHCDDSPEYCTDTHLSLFCVVCVCIGATSTCFRTKTIQWRNQFDLLNCKSNKRRIDRAIHKLGIHILLSSLMWSAMGARNMNFQFEFFVVEWHVL